MELGLQRYHQRRSGGLLEVQEPQLRTAPDSQQVATHLGIAEGDPGIAGDDRRPSPGRERCRHGAEQHAAAEQGAAAGT